MGRILRVSASILAILFAVGWSVEAQAQFVTVKCTNSYKGAKASRPKGIERRYCIVPLTIELTSYERIPVQVEGYANQNNVLYQGAITGLVLADDHGFVPMKVHGVDDDPAALGIMAPGCALRKVKAGLVRAYVDDMAWLDPAPATEITVKNYFECH